MERVEDTLVEDYDDYVILMEEQGREPMSFKEWYKYQEEIALWDSEEHDHEQN